MTTKPAEADTTNNNNNVPDTAELEQLVAEVDRGGRSVGGIAGAVIFLGALGWTLFQLWYVSPLPFTFGFGIFNDTEARSLHLGIAMFLGYMAYPARKKAP
ncbi:MAG TPA: C4-dicarboxylate ABC transporter, partial [Burkholderiaceae bacterium]|nr:C4-dicarboxylate ABC transporter [Burkholderiaceae bacterium]